MSAGQNESYDMSFLERIEEVHGYVLIANNHVDLIPLTSLRVIHGRKLYETSRRNSSMNTYYSLALYVMMNVQYQSKEVGLKEIHLNSLHGINKPLTVLLSPTIITFDFLRDANLFFVVINHYW